MSLDITLKVTKNDGDTAMLVVEENPSGIPLYKGEEYTVYRRAITAK